MTVRRLFDLDRPGAVVGSQDSHFIRALHHSCASLSPLSPAFGASEILPADWVIFMLIVHELLHQSEAMLEGIWSSFSASVRKKSVRKRYSSPWRDSRRSGTAV